MPAAATDEKKLIGMIKGANGAFAPAIVAEAKRERLPLALALALVDQESSFRNIFGCDLGPRDTVPWCHQDVTKDRVGELIRHVKAGGVSNGVGLTQLTSIGFIQQAQAEGGAHKPEVQLRVGFRLLHDLIERHGERVGLGAYNGGEGNPQLDYADDVLELKAKWHGRIRRALGGGDASPPGDAEVHRDLTLTTPETKGPDVKALQRALNARGKELPFTDVNLDTDSEFGTHTAKAAHRVAFALGLSDAECQKIKDGFLGQQSQQLIRDPSGLSPEDRQRRRARKPILKRRYEAHKAGARAAVNWARRQIGTTEHPKGSNWGHPVEDWITFTGYRGPVFWCGCFVAYAVVEKGGAQIPQRIRLGLDTNINEDAHAGKNGFERAVSVNDAKPGDIATFSFRHIALVAGPTRNGLIHTIDGNSSASNGSNNNGGEVAEHKRSVGQVTCVGRLRY
jgi:hypothetical protein